MLVIFKFFKYFPYFFFLIIVYLLRPFFLIRFQKIPSEQIGGFAENMETYLCKKKENPKKFQLDLFCLGKISNLQLARMVKRQVLVLPDFFVNIINLNKFLSKYFGFLSKHLIDIYDYRDVDNLYSKYPPNLKLLNSEEKRGWKILEEMGIPKFSKFVCFAIRDSEYKKFQYPNYFKDLSYHDFRDFDSDNFIPAAEYIAEQGLYVFRMGKKVKKKFFSKNTKIVDYANSKYRSDFMDIFIASNCEFCLTTATGIDTIPLISRKPIAAIVVPLAYVQNYNNKFINITKHHYLNGKKLNAEEIFKNNSAFFLSSNYFKEKNIILKEPNKNELLDFTKEAYDLFINKREYSNEEINFQKKYQTKMRDLMNYAKLNDPLFQNRIQPDYPKGFFGINFAKNNKFFFDF